MSNRLWQTGDSVGAPAGRSCGLAVHSLLLSVALLSGCGSTTPDQALAIRVDGLLTPLAAANQFSGAVVLARRGAVVYARGLGMANHEAGVAFTPDTPSDGGSLAKTLTAAGLWWLAREGRLDLDAPVVRYIPGFAHAQTTVRHLISHSDGLPNYEFFDPHFGKDQVRTTHAMLDVAARLAPTPSFPPGSRFEYTNFGFDVAALLIERVTGQSFEAFLRERFFSRLEMRSTFTRPARLADWRGVRTMGYRWQDGAWTAFDVFDMEGFLGASNIWFSAADLSRWASANAAGTALPAAVFISGQERSVIGGQRSPITGLSWYCDETDARCYYTGDINAFHGFVYWDRTRNESAVFVSNSALPPWSLITLQRGLVDALAGHPIQREVPLLVDQFDEGTRPPVAGEYVAEGIGTITLSSTGEGLHLRVGAALEFDVHQVSREAFYVPALDYWLVFSGGQPPASMRLRSMFVDATARRRTTAPEHNGTQPRREADTARR